jgi:DNA-binding NtrC family response regulator
MASPGGHFVASSPVAPREAAGDPAAPVRLLVVEDDPSVRTLLGHVLADDHHVIDQAASVDEAERLAAHQRPDIVIADVVMPGRSGIDLRREFVRRFPGLPVILISGYSPEQVAEFVARTPLTAFLPKPFSIADLRQMVEDALDGGFRRGIAPGASA